MKKPVLVQYKQPSSIKDYPVGPSFQAGHLVTTNSNYREIKPVLKPDSCIGCQICYLSCPDGAIMIEGKKAVFDYDFCKGCGICAKECKRKAIEMIREN